MKNNFGGTIPNLILGEDESELLALVTREIQSYIDNLEKIKWVSSEDLWQNAKISPKLGFFWNRIFRASLNLVLSKNNFRLHSIERSKIAYKDTLCYHSIRVAGKEDYSQVNRREKIQSSLGTSQKTSPV